MSLINVSNLTFSYDGSYDDIFTDVSFQIDTDWKLGFCGRNGRGKTTFLQLLMGSHEFRGEITASVDFEYFPFEVEDKTLNTIEILHKIAPDALLWQVERELSMLMVTDDVLHRPFSTLSNGEQTKTLLAGLFLRENAFLLIDEPTNHLDMSARENVSHYLNGKNGFILVSHDRLFLDSCVDHVLSINKANIEVTVGNFSTWWEQKKLRDKSELAEEVKLRKDIKRLESAARQSSRWADKVESAKMGKGAAAIRKGGHKNIDTMAYYAEKSRRMQQRRKNLERRQQSAIDEKSKLLKNLEEAEDLKIHPLLYHSSRLLSLENVSISYDNRTIVRDLSFDLKQGERLALLGGNGSGKSSILRLIYGGAVSRGDDVNFDADDAISHTGAVNIGSRLNISYIPQDASFLTGDLRTYAENHQLDEPFFKAILRKLDFSRVQFDKDMRDFSAGQKKKVLLARSLCEQAHIYIWDEPLNYIDVLSRIQIEELLIAYQPTMIFVEHDRVFCDNIATKSVHL